MKGLKNYEVLIAVFEHWRKRCGIKEVPIKRENRSDCFAAIVNYDNPDKMYLEYNSKKLGGLPLGLVINIALHEVGHLKHQLPFSTFIQKVEAEYAAETFAVDVMKKHFPKLHMKHTIKWAKNKLSDEKWCKKEISHSMAYARIKEYYEV